MVSCLREILLGIPGTQGKAEKPAVSGREYLSFMKPALFVFKLAICVDLVYWLFSDTLFEASVGLTIAL